MIKGFGLPGVKVEIGRAVSTDGGVVFVFDAVRGSGWFPQLVCSLRAAIAGFEGERYGFVREEKLERCLLALVAGSAMGYRSVNAIASVTAVDPVWYRALGKRVTQPELSRLMHLLGIVGLKSLREALAASAAEGRDGVYLDGDSTLIELHGTQEGASYNGHYHGFGYHAGWMVDPETGKLVALWLNPGKAYTSEGQAEVLQRLHAQGLHIRAYRGDAGMPSAELFALLDAHDTSYTLRLKSNARLDREAEQLLPAGPWQAGRVLMGEFRYAAKTWEQQRRVIAKLQKPVAKSGEESLFWEGFYFVTSRKDAPESVVSHYLARGRAEGIFGEFLQTLQPNFRHDEMVKNEAWAQLLGLAFNTLVELRDVLPREGAVRKVLTLNPELNDPGFVAIAIQKVKTFAKTQLTTFRTHALKLTSVFIRHARGETLRLHPTLLRPHWPTTLLEVAHE